MKKFTLFAAILMVASLASAQVTQGTIGQGNYTNYAGSTTTEYGLDFDNDGVIDVVIRDGYDFNGNACGKASFEYSDSKVQLVVPNSDSWDILRLMNVNEVVGSSCSFGGYGDGYFEDFSAISTSASYVGFRYTKNGQNHYAYAKLHRSGNDVVWDGVYYNATANTSITTGSTPTGIADRNINNKPAVRKVVIDGNLYIERDGKLYDFSGRQVR